MDNIDAEIIRQRVVNRYKQRTAFLFHLAAYIGGNLFFWGLWFMIKVNLIPASSPSDHILWPLIIMLLWGIVLALHAVAVVVGPRLQESQERAIQRETELAIARYGVSDEKPKRGTVRLSDDGELIAEDEEAPKRKVSEQAE